MRLLRESPTLTSLLISFTRSISHLLLAVLVPDCQFWWLLRLKVPIMLVTKTLASVTTGLLIMLPFRHAFLTGCGSRHFQTILKNQLPSLSPRHGLLRLILQSIFDWRSIVSLQDSVPWQTYQDSPPNSGGSQWEVVSYDYVQYLYNHVCCCQLRALHDFFRHVSTFLCQILDLITDAVHRARLLYSSACAAHPACCLGFGIMPIQVQSSHLCAELSDHHTCCKTPDYKYWMPILVKEFTVFQKMDWLSLLLLPLAKYCNRVFSAIMFTSLNSTINRTQAVTSSNALCTLVFERWFVVVRLLRLFQSWHSLDYNTIGAFISSTLAYSEHLYLKVPAGYDNDWGTASLCKSSHHLVQVSRQCHFLRREVFGLALVLGFGLMPVRRTSQVNSRPSFALHWQFLSTWISRSASKNRVVILWLWWSL